jgi:hypothetical protein
VAGVARAEGQWISLSAAQFAQTIFRTGAAGTSDDLFVAAWDGTSWSTGNIGGVASELHLNVAASGNHAPAVTVPSANVAATAGQVFQASVLFQASDVDNDPLTYFVYDNTAGANSGHFEVAGVAQSAGHWISLSPGQYAQTTFRAGSAGTSDDLLVAVWDGTTWSSGSVGGVASEWHIIV